MSVNINANSDWSGVIIGVIIMLLLLRGCDGCSSSSGEKEKERLQIELLELQKEQLELEMQFDQKALDKIKKCKVK